MGEDLAPSDRARQISDAWPPGAAAGAVLEGLLRDLRRASLVPSNNGRARNR